MDIQVRVPYTPIDSRTHIAENFMRSLNEHAGDGATISLPIMTLSELESLDVLLNMSQIEIIELRKNKMKKLQLSVQKIFPIDVKENPAYEL